MQARDGVTQYAVLIRAADAGLNRIPDRRGKRGVRKSWSSLLNTVLLGLVAAQRSLRGVEKMTAKLPRKVRRALGIQKRVSDSKVRDTVVSLQYREARECLVRYAKAEARRGHLKAVRCRLSLAAIDGKHIASLDEFDHPDIQFTKSEHRVYGKARVQRASLVSSKALVSLYERPIEGNTNEIGAMPRFLTELFDAYQHTSLIDGIIGDAGSGSKGVAAQIDDAQKVYILQLKDGSGDVFIEAQRLAVGKPDGEKRWMERGRQVCKRIWLHRLPESEEFCGWQHARFLVRVERTVTDLEMGEVEVGNRYWVSNCAIRDADEWMRMTQAYWRCENCQHWTADVFWKEDAKRTPWTTKPEAVFAISILRTLTINILAVLRSLSRNTWSNTQPSWDDIISRVRAIFTVRPTEPRRLPSLA